MEYWKKRISLALVWNSDMYNLRVIILIFFITFTILYGDGAPTPPAYPEIQAVSENEKIILLWDNSAESSIDSLTNYSDFEGYRIYRS